MNKIKEFFINLNNLLMAFFRFFKLDKCTFEAELIEVETIYESYYSKYKGSNDIDITEALSRCKRNIDILKERLMKFFPFGNVPDLFWPIRHRIQEDFILLQDKAEDYTTAVNLLAYIENSPISGERKDQFRNILNEIIKPNTAKPLFTPAENKLHLKNISNFLNCEVDKKFYELNVSRFIIFLHILTLLIIAALFFSIHLFVENNMYIKWADICCKHKLLYKVALLGAIGGTLSAVFTKSSIVLIRGRYADAILYNALIRPVTGAFCAGIFYLAVSYGYIFQLPPVVNSSTNPDYSLYLLAIVAGFGGEKLLKSTLGRMVTSLQKGAEKDQKPGDK